MPRAVIVITIVLLFAAGCRQKMYQTPRYEEYEASTLFRDSLSARPLEEGVVSRSGVRYGDRFPLYASSDTTVAAADSNRLVPFPVTRAVLERGQQQFNIYCSPCHSRLGDGRGIVVQRGLRAPPSLHTERLRNAPIGHFYDVMTNGYGAMYSYASRITREDRWTIAAYIRALQLSQHAALDAVPSDSRTELGMIRP